MSQEDRGSPLPSSVIATRIVDGIGVQSVINSGQVDPSINSVGLTATIASESDDLAEFSLWWLGPSIQIVVPANSIWPSMNPEVQITIMVNPTEQFFFPNTTTTNWFNGMDKVRRSEITITGGSSQDINTIKDLPWVARLAITTTNNVRSAQIVLQIIPISLASLYSMTDPESKNICVISFPVIQSPWSHSPDPDMRFPGPLPVFRDRRGFEAKTSGIFPPSQVVKRFVRKSMLSCSANPSLEASEVAALVNDQNLLPSLRPAVVAEWPEIPPDNGPPPLSNLGLKSSIPSSVIKGGPVRAADQTKVGSAALSSMAMQSGLPSSFDVAPVNTPLSNEAKNRFEIMNYLFDGDLPPTLPSWDLLSKIPQNDCYAIIQTKKDRTKETDSGSDAEAFQKATSPITYSTVQIDDGLAQLHSARFNRAPFSEPIVWAHLMEKKRPYVTTFLPEDPVGGSVGVSDVAIKKMHDRCAPLELKHILKSNAHVEKSAPISKRRAVESSGIGDSCELTYINDFDYKEALYPWEVLESLCTAAAVHQQIWPLDCSFINIIRVIVRYQLFYHADINSKFQMLLCRNFVNEAFLANSRKARSGAPPLSLKQLKELAGAVLWDKKRTGDPQHYVDLATSSGPLKPGQNPESFFNFSMSNLARAQAQVVKTQQQQLQRVGSYGAGRGGALTRDSRRVGKAASASATAPSAPLKKNLGIQVCPSFSKAEPCPRGGDASGSCKASSGIILHHICSICTQSSHGRDNHK